MYRDDLEFELGRSLLKWMRNRRPGIHDWQPYLDSSLWHRALDLVEKWRRRDHRNIEFSSVRDPPHFPSIEPEPTDKSPPDSAQRLSTFQRRLGNADRHFLKLLKDRGGNISRLARDLGVHRNTIHRRLGRIINKCPVEIESAPSSVASLRSRERAELDAIIQQPRVSARHMVRTRIILSVLDGRSYSLITQNLGVSAATIARCRRRFEKQGVGGLIAGHRGRKPSRARRRLQKWLRIAKAGKNPSVRYLAGLFGLGKSTVQRILKANP